MVYNGINWVSIPFGLSESRQIFEGKEVSFMRFVKRITAPLVVMMLILTLTVAVSAAPTGAVSCGNTTYVTLSEAVAAATPGSSLQLKQNITETLTVDKDLTLDLCGYKVSGTVTVAEGFTLKIKDSSTDDFTSSDGCGLIKTVGNAQAETGYIAIAERNGTSYHRLDLQISSVNLRPGNAGIYFGSNYGGDEAVKARIKTYGMVMSLAGAPTVQDIISDTAYTTHTAFSGDSWVCGETGKAYGTLLKDIMKSANTTEKNTENAKRNIYSVSYAELNDGTYVLGDPVTINLQEVAERVDTIWNTLSPSQVTGMKEMFQAYEPIMENWNVPNLQKSLHSQVYVDYTTNSDGTVTATFSVDGNVALAMLELQLELQLKNAVYADYQILTGGSADANCVGNTFYFSLMSATDMDITRRTDLFSITFKNVTPDAEIIFRVADSIVSDGTFTDIRNVCVAGTKYN